MPENTKLNVSEDLSQSVVVYKNIAPELLLVDVAIIKEYTQL